MSHRQEKREAKRKEWVEEAVQGILSGCYTLSEFIKRGGLKGSELDGIMERLHPQIKRLVEEWHVERSKRVIPAGGLIVDPKTMERLRER